MNRIFAYLLSIDICHPHNGSEKDIDIILCLRNARLFERLGIACHGS